MVKEEEEKVWKYTDDIVAVVLIVAWLVCWAIGHKLPEWILTTVLGYIFGKNIPIQR